MKNEKICFNKSAGIIVLVIVLLVGLAVAGATLTQKSTSTSTRAEGPRDAIQTLRDKACKDRFDERYAYLKSVFIPCNKDEQKLTTIPTNRNDLNLYNKPIDCCVPNSSIRRDTYTTTVAATKIKGFMRVEFSAGIRAGFAETGASKWKNVYKKDLDFSVFVINPSSTNGEVICQLSYYKNLYAFEANTPDLVEHGLCKPGILFKP